MDGRPEEVRIKLALGPDARPERLEKATAQLCRELRGLRVGRVSLATSGPAPAGARAGDALELGALIVAIARTPGMITALGDVLSGWIAAHHNRSVVVVRGDDRIELTGVSRDDQTRMSRLFDDVVRQD